jgi:4-amino-4-deoxy-L-arabinose transferase-like glycosyltransferase
MAEVRVRVLSLLLLSFLTFFAGLGRQAITDSDEAFYAEAAREMVESGDWLTPHFNYQDRWQKPVLYYWLTAALYLVAGPVEWAARFWSALSGVGLVLVTWYAARSLTDDVAAWLAGAIVATCCGYFAMARLALPDLPLAFCVTCCIWMALERRWVLAGLAAGLGFLMKGPVALVVAALVVVPIWWRERRRLVGRNPGEGGRAIDWRGVAVATGIFALIGLPWYVAMVVEHGPAYLQSFFVGDNLERFATGRFNEPRPIWFYLPIVIGGMLPWSAFLLVLPWRALSAIVRRQRRLTDVEWRLVIWALAPLLFFTLSIGKQPRYILPVLPPLAILLAQAIAVRLPRRGVQSQRGLTTATWLTAALYLVLAIVLWRARPIFISAYPANATLGLAAMVAAALALAWIAATGTFRALPPVMATCAAALLLAVQFGALAGVRPEPVEQVATLIAQHRHGDEPVGEYQVFVRNLVFYARFPQRELFNETVARDFIHAQERALIVVREPDLARLEAAAGRTLHRLGEIRYLNTANLKLRTLVAPDPEQDVETVVLASTR